MTRRRRHVAVSLVAACVGSLAVLAGAAGPAVHAAASPLGWSVPVSADAAKGISGVSCPSTSLCVAVDRNGNVVTSTTPTGGATAWKVSNVDGTNTLFGVSCPDANLCVAGDNAGNVVTSTNPSGGTAAWNVTSVDGSNGLEGISCPSDTMCVAVDNVGNVVTSTNPTGGPTAWVATDVDMTNPVVGVSCPSASFCVAVDGAGDVLTSSNPTALPPTWTPQLIDPSNRLTAVSCPTSTLCAAVDASGTVFTSTSPSGGIWNMTQADAPNSLSGVSCTTALCVAVDLSGNAVTSTNPTGAPAAWTKAVVYTSSLNGVSCTSGLCAAVGVAVVTTPDPTVASPWTMANPDGPFDLEGVSCPGPGFCVAVDTGGNVVISNNPVSGPWTVTHVDDHPLQGVSCASTTLCVAVDDSGDVVSSSNPTGGVGAWTVTPVDGPHTLYGVSCTTGLCVAVDDSGNVITSTTPTAGPWSVPAAVDSGNFLYSVSCPSAALCVAGDGAGSVVTATNPTGGATAWTKALVTNGGALYGVSCPMTSLCAAVDNGANAVTSTVPTGGAAAWTESATGDSPQILAGVSCSSGNLCVGVGTAGELVTSTDPTAGSSTWTVNKVGGDNLVGVSCPTDGLCVVVDGSGGNVIIGKLATTTVVASSSTTVTAGSALTYTATVAPIQATGTVSFTDNGAVVTSCDAVAVSTSGTASCATNAGSPGIHVIEATYSGDAAYAGSSGMLNQQVTASGNVYTALTPQRILDTRSGGTLGPGGSVILAIGGVYVPANATSVILNVTAVDQTTAGFFTVYPTGGSPPNASNLNWVAGETIPNLVSVGLSSAGDVTIFNGLGSADAVVDLEGYFAPATTSTAGEFVPVAPARITDTRNAIGNINQGMTLNAGTTLIVQVTGAGGVPPTGVSAVVLNVTAVDQTADGFFTVFPTGAALPTASNLNWTPGDTVPNRVIVPVGTGGKVSIYNGLGSADAIVDVNGYFTDSTAGGASYNSFFPTRIVDTRTINGGGPLGGASTMTVAVAGVIAPGSPSSPKAVILNITVADPTAPSDLVVWPADGTMPLASDLNFVARQTVPNLVVVKLSATGQIGQIDIFNAFGSTNVIVDVVGWFG